MNENKTWHPTWWNESHSSAWDNVREAMRRDWEQTRHDLGLPGGHELNQGVADTVKQAVGMERSPREDRANPPKVIGSWNDVELPVGYGYGARQRYGAEHPVWNEGLELRLRAEWEAREARAPDTWSVVNVWVRRGYEYAPRS